MGEKKAGFAGALNALREDPKAVFDKFGRQLSDLTPAKAAQVREVLQELSEEKRLQFFQAMDSSAEEELIYDFTPIAMLGIDDPDAAIRTAALNVLYWEDTEQIGKIMLEKAASDPDENVRIAAIKTLGQYMLEHHMENDIPVDPAKLKETLSALLDNPSAAVRREAVASYALSGDKRVKEIISGYFAGNDRDELMTALQAVSLSLLEDWNDVIMELISSENEDIRQAAIHTAGELQLKEALPVMYEIIANFDHVSPELLLETVSAVSEIGHSGSLEVLEVLGEAAVDMDEEITDQIDDAIMMLDASLNMGGDVDFNLWEERKLSPKKERVLNECIRKAEDRCLTILEEKIPIDNEEDEEDEHDEHEHHDHRHELDDLDISRFRILDDLKEYEKNADFDEDEEALWEEFENLNEEDLDAESLAEFLKKIRKKK